MRPKQCYFHCDVRKKHGDQFGPKEGGSRHQTDGRRQDLMEPPAPQDPPRNWAKTVANSRKGFQYVSIFD